MNWNILVSLSKCVPCVGLAVIIICLELINFVCSKAWFIVVDMSVVLNAEVLTLLALVRSCIKCLFLVILTAEVNVVSLNLHTVCLSVILLFSR